MWRVRKGEQPQPGGGAKMVISKEKVVHASRMAEERKCQGSYNHNTRKEQMPGNLTPLQMLKN
jgi:hypothetical protein